MQKSIDSLTRDECQKLQNEGKGKFIISQDKEKYFVYGSCKLYIARGQNYELLTPTEDWTQDY